MRDADVPAALPAQYHRARRGGRPLCGGRALTAVGEREAVLPLRRAEMRGRGRDQPARRAALDEARTERQPLRHGRARAVLPEVRHVRLHGRKERADALVEQVARKDHVKVAFLQAALFERSLDRGFLQLALGQLPRFLPHAVVLGHEVKLRAERAVALLFADR